MTAGAESAYLQKQVERVLKALSGRFDLASAMGVEGFADVFGPVLERRAEESRKRPRSEGIPAAEPSVTALGVQPRQSGSTQHAAEAIGLSHSSHAARPPSRATDSSQAVEEDAGQQVQPTLKKARTAKGKARQDKPSEEEAVVRSEVEDSGRGGQGTSDAHYPRSYKLTIPCLQDPQTHLVVSSLKFRRCPSLALLPRASRATTWTSSISPKKIKNTFVCFDKSAN